MWTNRKHWKKYHQSLFDSLGLKKLKKKKKVDIKMHIFKAKQTIIKQELEEDKEQPKEKAKIHGESPVL